MFLGFLCVNNLLIICFYWINLILDLSFLKESDRINNVGVYLNFVIGKVMLEAVGNTPITATIAKAQPIQQSATAPEVSGQQEVGQFAKSRIRVDNFLDRAILELRSKETGEVIQQYPTEQQIKAFDRPSISTTT